MTEPLTTRTCTPCQGGAAPLTADAARAHLAQVPAWALMDGARRIERTWRFDDFAQAFALVQAAAELAEAEGHHPDIRFGWGYVTISIHTHKIDGLHENDFILAAKIDAAT